MTSRVLIFGSRHFSDRDLLFRCLDKAAERLASKGSPITEVISGTARGADTIGEHWAQARGIAVRRFPAQWDRYGKRAGPLRNQQMLTEGGPTHAVGFMYRNSRGTADMYRRLTAAGVPTWLLRLE